SLLSFRFGGSLFETVVYANPLTILPANAAINLRNDMLLSVVMASDELNTRWNARSQMRFSYNPDVGFVTDLFGIRLGSYSDQSAVEKRPPEIRFATAVVGSDKIYLRLTEGILNPDNPGSDPVSSDILIDSVFEALNPIAGIEVIGRTETEPYKAIELMLTLDQPISAAFALDARIGLANTVEDSSGNTGINLADRRAVDLAQTAIPSNPFDGGLLSVLGASDGVHTGDPTLADGALGPGSLGLLRNLDGSGRLYDRDTTIFTSLLLSGVSSPPSYPLTMYFDVNPPIDTGADFSLIDRPASLGTFWLPSILPGFNLKANTDARAVSPFFVSSTELSRNFRISAADDEIEAGSSVGLLFRYGPLWIARASDINDPRAFDLWRYRIEDVVTQRGGVTVLNNVIDSVKKERVALQVDLGIAGQVSVLVFTLDGDVVRTLHRGRLAAGVYTMTWDGSNTGGSSVARGIYFIRVVAPGIDEIRKVMVIKN
ncbi:MAG: FlgD immunoglobulin-like domain containing protein, partial [Spirochaetota bacterium]